MCYERKERERRCRNDRNGLEEAEECETDEEWKEKKLVRNERNFLRVIYSLSDVNDPSAYTSVLWCTDYLTGVWRIYSLMPDPNG